MNPRAPPATTGLTRRQFWGVLAAALAVFALAAGPVWRNPWAIDASVFVSYLVVPPLVLAVLLVSHRFTWRDFALDALTVTLAKFGVTYVAAAALWALSGEPPRSPPPPPPRFAPAPVEVAAPVPTAQAASLEGVVVAGGAPRAGTLVWLARGTERHAYPARTDVIEIADDGRGFVPPVAAVQIGQILLLRSGDGRLHAIRGTDDRGRTVFNVAVPSGATPVRLDEPAGVVTLSCAVHDHVGRERAGRLVVLAHPFFATTAADGRFRFDGLPPGRIVVRALDDQLGGAEQTVELPSAEPVALTLAAAPARPARQSSARRP